MNKPVIHKMWDQHYYFTVPCGGNGETVWMSANLDFESGEEAITLAFPQGVSHEAQEASPKTKCVSTLLDKGATLKGLGDSVLNLLHANEFRSIYPGSLHIASAGTGGREVRFRCFDASNQELRDLAEHVMKHMSSDEFGAKLQQEIEPKMAFHATKTSLGATIPEKDLKQRMRYITESDLDRMAALQSLITEVFEAGQKSMAA